MAVAGAAGRMGEATCRAIDRAEDMVLSGRADPLLDASVADVLPGADVMVDFTRPDTARENVREALDAGVHVVVGTTGAELESLGARSAGDDALGPHRGRANLFIAPNFAIGAVLMMQAAAMIAAHMPECEIVELHHDRKLDAPSGTAARTAELIDAAGGHVHRPIHSVRLPGLVAHQEVIFGGEGQTLSIRHDSIARESFMPGVLLAVRRVGSLDRSPVVGLEHLL